jgi:hypothetical protein
MVAPVTGRLNADASRLWPAMMLEVRERYSSRIGDLAFKASPDALGDGSAVASRGIARLRRRRPRVLLGASETG